MSWFFFAILSVFFFAAQSLLMRILAIKTEHPRVFSFVFNSWGILFALIAFLLQKGSIDVLFTLNPTQYLLIIISGVLYGLYERFQFIARKGIDASSLSIIYQLVPVIAFFGSILILHETLTVEKILGAALTISASFFLIYKNPKLQFNSAIGYSLLCAIFLGIAWITDKPASAPMSAVLYSIIMWSIPIAIIAFPHLKGRQLIKEFNIGGWKVALAALFNVVGFIFSIQALTLADASRVVPIIETNSILTVIGGIIILKEHDHLSRKIIAVLLAFIGILLLR